MQKPETFALSQIRQVGGSEEGFKKMVDAFAVEMTAWSQHMAKVGKDPAYQPYNMPDAHKLVKAAVAVSAPEGDGTWISHYVIQDDSPPPEAVLRNQKNALMSQVLQMEANASVAIYPPGKRRLYEMKEAAVLKRDAERGVLIRTGYQEQIQERYAALSPEEKKDPHAVATATKAPAEHEIQKEILDGRPAEDIALIQEVKAIREKLDANAMHAAQTSSDIEDLTVETIGGWTVPAFPYT